MKRRNAFTIVELLTVMSIIIILFSLLVPAMNMIRRYAKTVKQNAQFHSISAGIELYKNDFDGYPPSSAKDEADKDYCGAMKFAEAMVGQDLLGFHPASLFRQDGTNPALSPNDDLYPEPFNPDTDSDHRKNLRTRKGPYLKLEGANVYPLVDLYGKGNTSPFDPCSVVLCDEYPRTRNQITGKRVGMPILYYRANTSRLKHNYADREESIYNSDDNQDLVDLGLPWDIGGGSHPIASTGTTPDGDSADPAIFYVMTRDKNISATARPCRADSYILISAGFDSLYGTRDDIFNFEK